MCGKPGKGRHGTSEWGLYCNHLVRPSVRSHFRNRYLSFYWKKWFYIWYMALAWWLVPNKLIWVVGWYKFQATHMPITHTISRIYFVIPLLSHVEYVFKQDVARYVVLRIHPLVHLCQICIYICISTLITRKCLMTQHGFYIWYMALAWWLVPCLPFPGLPHIYFLFTVRLRIFHVCRNKNFRNSYLSF
jgi:hypothetical protein